MPIEYCGHITRDMLRAAPEKLFVFGDNLHRSGYAGQAKEMRGEPNAVGLPTKHTPGMSEGDFFKDEHLNGLIIHILPDLERIRKHLFSGGTVVWPRNDIGTGLAQLQQRAPAIHAFYRDFLKKMEAVNPTGNKVRVIRILEYTGSLDWLTSTFNNNAVKGTYLVSGMGQINELACIRSDSPRFVAMMQKRINDITRDDAPPPTWPKGGSY